jgi:tetratricopeptide (TPR) repeat protein
MNKADVARLRDGAVAAARDGDQNRASELFAAAVAAAPSDASILNSAGNHASASGDTSGAIALFERAIAADSSATEPLINLAILLTGAERASLALELLLPYEGQLLGMSRYWSVRASAERAAGDKRSALRSYERAADLDPANARAAEGRARLALETGRDAREPYRVALNRAPNSATAMMGFGQAFEAAGEADRARVIAEALVDRFPQWVDALEWLAQLRWTSGERLTFADHYAGAALRAGKPQVYTSWCRMLAGVDQFEEAASVAARARRELGDDAHFRLLEAVHAGEAGDYQRAELIFAKLELCSVDRWVHEARHRLRLGDPTRAEVLAGQATDESPDNVAAWALRDIAWRMMGNERHQWLHGAASFVQQIELELDQQQLVAAIACLDGLHDQSTMPVGQSVREGSQTRGGLFDRHEPEVHAIEASFRRAVEVYRQQLPGADGNHPLLRHRDAPWRFAGSWSIRVFGGGRHKEHVHPNGIVSSAAYFVVPPCAATGDDQAGWLELGRPPPDLRLDLPPLFAIEPRPGTCALFPSTLYHGTRPFANGKRMTVAVDVHRATS